MDTQLPFSDRRAAGRALGAAMEQWTDRANVLVLALPRGGVPVAYEVAQRLRVPLDVLIVRKLGVPGQEEFAFGAIAGGGAIELNQEVIRSLGLDAETVNVIVERETDELERRERTFRGERPFPDVRGREIILVDDGLATGSTMRAAIAAMRSAEAAKIVVAVPVAPPEQCAAIEREVDEFICLAAPQQFGGVGRWYVDFVQLTDEEVRELLAAAKS